MTHGEGGRVGLVKRAAGVQDLVEDLDGGRDAKGPDLGILHDDVAHHRVPHGGGEHCPAVGLEPSRDVVRDQLWSKPSNTTLSTTAPPAESPFGRISSCVDGKSSRGGSALLG